MRDVALKPMEELDFESSTTMLAECHSRPDEPCGFAWAAFRASERPHKRTALVDRTIEFLAEHYSEAMSLAEVALAVGASPAHLSSAFHAASGRTMHSYREELRLRRSLDLLPGCRGDFTRVALDLGFSSHSHFTSRFHRMFGITPSEYVASIRDDSPPLRRSPRLLRAF